MRQHSLFPGKFPLHHGGELALGRRKGFRPLARKRPMHLVLKAKRPLRRHEPLIKGEARRLAEKFSFRLYDLAVAVDHVHLAFLVPGRREYKAFLRALTGLLARKIGKALWALPPFSRIASWGKDFTGLRKYFRKNREEARGERVYEARRDWYKRFRKNH